MSESQLQFRVGLLTIGAIVICTVLVIQFGDVRGYFEETYRIGIHFAEAPGLQKGTPVRQNGISVGSVSDVLLDDTEGGVLVVIKVQDGHRFRRDSQPMLVRTLLGDSSIEFSPGASEEYLPANSRIEGIAPTDPMEIVRRMEVNVTKTLVAFEDTSREWQRLAQNVNNLVDTKQGDLDDVIERAAESLQQFTKTMQTADVTLTEANEILSDPQLRQDLKDTVAALPEMVRETRETIAAARMSVQKVGDNLDNLAEATDPLAEHSRSMVLKLDGGLGQLESLLTELNTFAKMVNAEDGSLQRFASDPELYEHLDESAAALALMVRSLEPILRDIAIFSDKIARHPELIGVSGALRGSSGIKEADDAPGGAQIQQTGGVQP